MTMLFKILSITLMVIFSGFAAVPSPAEDYDLVILGGRVMDPGSKLDAVRNVGVKNGKIAIVTKRSIKGRETINASGHVVAPGFIDPHNHNLSVPFGQKLSLRDGITTLLELEGGVLPVDTWYKSMHGKSQANYGATVSVMSAREMVLNSKFNSRRGATINDLMYDPDSHAGMNWSTVVATDKEIEKIVSLLEKGLKQGALGVGHTPGYMTSGLSSRESYEVQRLAAKYGLFVSMHGRFSSQMPPTTGVLGTEEQIAAMAAEGGGLIVVHMTAQCLNLTKQCLYLIDKTREKGYETIAEVYPYTYGATIAGADYLHPDNYQKNMGHDYKDIVETSTMKPLTKERYEELLKTAPRTAVTFENAGKEYLYLALAHPTSIIGSDAFPFVKKTDGSLARDWDTPYDSVNGHPRGSGTYARTLRLTREENLMPLMLALSKITYMPAKFLEDNGVSQMANKGRIKVGADADITIFDPKTIKDNGTPDKGGLPSTGIPYVIVNGTVVVKDSKVLKGVYPGKPVRLPVKH